MEQYLWKRGDALISGFRLQSSLFGHVSSSRSGTSISSEQRGAATEPSHCPFRCKKRQRDEQTSGREEAFRLGDTRAISYYPPRIFTLDLSIPSIVSPPSKKFFASHRASRSGTGVSVQTQEAQEHGGEREREKERERDTNGFVREWKKFGPIK